MKDLWQRYFSMGFFFMILIKKWNEFYQRVLLGKIPQEPMQVRVNPLFCFSGKQAVPGDSFDELSW